MILFISPAKTFRKTTETKDQHPMFMNETEILIKKLKSLSPKTLEHRMKISSKVADQTYHYYQTFGMSKSSAIYTYFGHQYKHINPESLNNEEMEDMNNRLYIMDGLFGLLRPLDQISYYRLEMQDKTIKNLYHFWSPKIIDYLRKYHKDDILINLASNEYGQIIKDLEHTYTIEFYQQKHNKLSIHSMEAKKMRGLLVNHIFKNQLKTIEELYDIEIEGYKYSKEHSKEKDFIFIKEL